MDKKKSRDTWSLRNIILVALIAIFCGVIFWGVDFIYNALTALLTPIGLGPAANDILMGLWTMAGPLAGYIIHKPGAAFLAEFLGSGVEAFLGGQWGAATFISGLVQGIPSELGFAVTGYKRYDWVSLNLSIFFTVVITFGWDMIRNGYSKYHFGLLIALFVIRYVSTFIFGGLLTRAISKMLDRSQILPNTAA